MTTPEHVRRTRAAYDKDAEAWTARSVGQRMDAVHELRRRVDGTILDMGCGPGFHLDALAPSIGVDLSAEMLTAGSTQGRAAQANMVALPIARESIDGVWASRSLVHLPRREVPTALAELHRVVRRGGRVGLWLFEGDQEGGAVQGDRLPGRTFSYWPPELLNQTVSGAGFEITNVESWLMDDRYPQLLIWATRQWTLPDYVGPDMDLLICGLNPSPSSADSGVGFFKAGNRFWPAAIKAGVVTKDRDPFHALAAHGMGMTDMVKRPTRRADELDKDEYAAGFERLTNLVEWLQPKTICMVGLAGWRAAVNRKAQRGWQPETIAGRSVYLMPSTSGLNAHDTVDTLADHLRVASVGR